MVEIGGRMDCTHNQHLLGYERADKEVTEYGLKYFTVFV